MAIKQAGRSVLTLQHFVLQSEFIHAYRAAIRATRPLPDSKTRRETVDWLRGDVERLREVYNLDALNTSLSSFHRTVKTMTPSLGLSGLDDSQGAKLIGRSRPSWEKALGI